MSKNLIRKKLLNIFKSTLKSLQPEQLLEKQLPDMDYRIYHKIVIFGIGKAAKKMAEAVSRKLPKKPDLVYLADEGHPLPTMIGVKKTEKIISEASKLTQNDLAIVLISGGGSAMFVKPAVGILLNDKIEITKKLLRSGANINEINIIRKHISHVKGGQFAKILYPAKVISFIISDVIGNDLGTIASGPLIPDQSTFEDAINILNKYHIKPPKNIQEYLKKGVNNTNLETPKSNDVFFKDLKLKIVADHKLVAHIAEQHARRLGFATEIYSTHLSGESRDKSRKMVRSCLKPILYIASGETTVTIKGEGSGGRNQEFVLAALPLIKRNQTMIAISTDGIDGICPEPIAGAFADYQIKLAAKNAKLDLKKFLANNDSYNFFKNVDGLIRTGPTGTNVGDFVLLYNQK